MKNLEPSSLQIYVMKIPLPARPYGPVARVEIDLAEGPYSGGGYNQPDEFRIRGPQGDVYQYLRQCEQLFKAARVQARVDMGIVDES